MESLSKVFGWRESGYSLFNALTREVERDFLLFGYKSWEIGGENQHFFKRLFFSFFLPKSGENWSKKRELWLILPFSLFGPNKERASGFLLVYIYGFYLIAFLFLLLSWKESLGRKIKESLRLKLSGLINFFLPMKLGRKWFGHVWAVMIWFFTSVFSPSKLTDYCHLTIFTIEIRFSLL